MDYYFVLSWTSNGRRIEEKKNMPMNLHLHNFYSIQYTFELRLQPRPQRPAPNSHLTFVRKKDTKLQSIMLSSSSPYFYLFIVHYQLEICSPRSTK